MHLTRGPIPALPLGIEARVVERAELERSNPGLRPESRRGLFEPNCADIDVAALHAAYLRRFRKLGGTVEIDTRLQRAILADGTWTVRIGDGSVITTSILVNAAGAWTDPVAVSCGVGPIGIKPFRRTMVQLRVGRTGLRDLPLVDDADGTFYFKGEGDQSIWLSPHDEIPTDPCDAAPDEIDVATAIDRFQQVVDWPVLRVERSWAGLRSFAPDRLPVYGFDPRVPGFFWCAGQGGFGIQTSPAAAMMAAAMLLGEPSPAMVEHIEPRLFSLARFSV